MVWEYKGKGKQTSLTAGCDQTKHFCIKIIMYCVNHPSFMDQGDPSHVQLLLSKSTHTNTDSVLEDVVYINNSDIEWMDH